MKGLTYSSHHAVVSAFGKEFVKSGLLPDALHRALIDAAEARNISDYQVHSGMTRQAAASHIESADSFVAAAERYFETKND